MCIQNQPSRNTSWSHSEVLLILSDVATVLRKDHVRVAVTAENVLQCLLIKRSDFYHYFLFSQQALQRSLIFIIIFIPLLISVGERRRKGKNNQTHHDALRGILK